MDDRVTAKQIAQAMQVSRQAVGDRADKESWPFEEVSCRGGKRRVYPVADLPADVRMALAEAPLVDPDPTAAIRRETPKPLPPVVGETIQKWQRDCRDARLVILTEIDRMAALEGIEAALAHFVALAKTGELNETMTRAVALANARKGKRAALSASSLRGWRRAMTGGGPDALIPEPSRKAVPVPRWLPAFMKRYRVPTKPSIAWCYEKMFEDGEGDDLPCLRDVQRRIKGLGIVEANRGRLGPREMRRLMAYVKRDFSELLPTDIYTGDGHTADIEVQHPEHGRPFRPEITSILDVATRKCVGWSVGIAESSWLVADALRVAQECGVGALFYADRGSGFKNWLLEGPGLGILARVGTRFEHSIPFNSQARGIIEAFNKFWIREAKASPAFVGKDMDKEARHAMFVRTRAEVKELGFAKSLMPWETFTAWVADRVISYNNHPHSSLPVIRDPESGRKRHMTPNEQWAALAPQTEIVLEDRAVLDDLFRPYKVTTVDRCLVKVMGHEYYNKPVLTPYHGQEVMVGYDVRDVSKVWVRDMEERLLCVAALDGNVQPYFAKSVMEIAREKRAKGRLARLARKEDEVLAELNGGQPAIDITPSESAITIRAALAADMAKQKAAVHAMPEAHVERQRYNRWLAVNAAIDAGQDVPERDRKWWASYQQTHEFSAQTKLREWSPEAATAGH